jgi:hypothetical protein
VHISELSNRYTQDAKTKRIALSMKSQQTPPPKPKPKASLDDLAARWKVR